MVTRKIFHNIPCIIFDLSRKFHHNPYNHFFSNVAHNQINSDEKITLAAGGANERMKTYILNVMKQLLYSDNANT